MSENLLPVHGFVLAGGKSSRMGVDKATLEFCGRPMVEIAVEKLRGFCADVSIAGNREDLGRFAEVVREERLDAGPAAGIEAGLRAARQEWVMFVPVDVPLVPGELLRRWAWDGLRRASSKYFGGSYLTACREDQPTFCFLPRSSHILFRHQLDAGNRKIMKIFDGLEPQGEIKAISSLAAEDIAGIVRPPWVQMERWFTNVNTIEELVIAESWATSSGQ